MSPVASSNVVGPVTGAEPWRPITEPAAGASPFASAPVEMTIDGDVWRWRRTGEAQGGWWKESGVHQNITFPVHPDPISGMHCWHQRVIVEPAAKGDRAGDVAVDTAKSAEVYRNWLAKTRENKNADGLRRPLWFNRPLRPTDAAYYR